MFKIPVLCEEEEADDNLLLRRFAPGFEDTAALVAPEQGDERAIVWPIIASFANSAEALRVYFTKQQPFCFR